MRARLGIEDAPRKPKILHKFIAGVCVGVWTGLLELVEYIWR